MLKIYGAVFVFFSPSVWKSISLIHANEFSLISYCVRIIAIAFLAQKKKSANLEMGRSTCVPRDEGGFFTWNFKKGLN